MLQIPFPGNKSTSYRKVAQIFKEGGYDTVLEPFGGSCVLSVNLKSDGLAKTAAINDYDGLFRLYPEYLDIKDKLVEGLNSAGIYRTISRRSGNYRYLDEEETLKVKVPGRMLRAWEIEILQSMVGRIDRRYWRLLAYENVFTHSGVAVHRKIYLSDFRYLYGNTSTDKQRGYLAAAGECLIDSLDWRAFLKKNEGLIGPKSLVILDPPYFGTANHGYASGFSEDDTIALLSEMRRLGCDFLLFNKDREWMEDAAKAAGLECFETVQCGTPNQSVSHNRREYMLYVWGGGVND